MSTKGKKIRVSKKGNSDQQLALTNKNYLIFGIGILVIILGYIFLARGPWNSTSSLTIAPILLVIGYAVIVPLPIMFRQKGTQDKQKS